MSRATSGSGRATRRRASAPGEGPVPLSRPPDSAATTSPRRGRAGAASPQGAGPWPVDQGVAELLRDPQARRAWVLLLDGVPSSHVDLDDPRRLEFEYVRWIGDVLDAAGPAGVPLDVLHLGGGAATLARYVAATRPGSRQTVAEPDGRLVDLVRAVLPMDRPRGVRWRVLDAAGVLAHEPGGRRDVVVRDAFAGARVPPELTTVGFAREVRRALRPGGLYVLNLADGAPLRAARAEAATLAVVFPEVCAVVEPAVARGRRTGNVVLVAGDGPLPVDGLHRALARGGSVVRVVDPAAVRGWTVGVDAVHDPADAPARVWPTPDGIVRGSVPGARRRPA